MKLLYVVLNISLISGVVLANGNEDAIVPEVYVPRFEQVVPVRASSLSDINALRKQFQGRSIVPSISMSCCLPDFPYLVFAG